MCLRWMGSRLDTWQGSLQIRIPSEREDDSIEDEGTAVFLLIIAHASTIPSFTIISSEYLRSIRQPKIFHHAAFPVTHLLQPTYTFVPYSFIKLPDLRDSSPSWQRKITVLQPCNQQLRTLTTQLPKKVEGETHLARASIACAFGLYHLVSIDVSQKTYAVSTR